MVQQRLCLLLSTMTVLQGPEAVSSLLGDALMWAEQVTLPHQEPSIAEAWQPSAAIRNWKQSYEVLYHCFQSVTCMLSC